jgi:ketosteroid isomerase-like protein
MEPMRAFHTVRGVLLLATAACQGRGADSAPIDSPAMTAGVTGGRSIEDSVRTLEQVWADAVRTRDSSRLEQLMAPDFTLASAADSARPPVPRAVWMQNTLQHLRVDSIRLGPAQVTVHGDTARATLQFVWAGQFMQTPPFRDSTQLTDTWVRGSGGWRVHRRVMVE